MAYEEPGLVRELAVQAWRESIGRPVMWLIVSASSLPFVFLLNFVVGNATGGGLDLALFIAGYTICFAVFFLFWCMAVRFYDSEAREKGSGSLREAFRGMQDWSRPSALTGLTAGLVSVIGFMIAQMVVGLILSFIAAGQSGSQGALIALSYINFYLSFLAADLIIVFIALAPQILQLENGRGVEQILRVSYLKVKDKYRTAFLLFVIPEIVTRSLLIGAGFLITRLSGVIYIFVLLLISMILLEGARISFVAAAFNHFYYYLLEEEQRKRKVKPQKQTQKQARRR